MLSRAQEPPLLAVHWRCGQLRYPRSLSFDMNTLVFLQKGTVPDLIRISFAVINWNRLHFYSRWGHNWIKRKKENTSMAFFQVRRSRRIPFFMSFVLNRTCFETVYNESAQRKKGRNLHPPPTPCEYLFADASF